MTDVSGPIERRGLRSGTGAIVIALVYALVGPLVGAVIVIPIGTVLAAQFSSGTLIETFDSVLGTMPFSLLLSYAFAGALATATGIVVATVAYRRGRAPVGTAIAAPVAVFIAFVLLRRFVHIDIPGTGILRGGGQAGMLLWLAVCIAASLICWLVTLPLQKRAA
jgi:putative flippase GtrA